MTNSQFFILAVTFDKISPVSTDEAEFHLINMFLVNTMEDLDLVSMYLVNTMDDLEILYQRKH